MRKRNEHIGSFLDDFLKEEGFLEEARATAAKEAPPDSSSRRCGTKKISKAQPRDDNRWRIIVDQ